MITKAHGYLARASSLLSKDAGAGGEREKLDVAAACLCAGAATSQLLDSPGAGGGLLGGGVTASSPKSSSTVNTANYQLIKHISWVYDF